MTKSIIEKLNGNTMNILTIVIMLVGWGINIGIMLTRLTVVEEKIIDIRASLQSEECQRLNGDKELFSRSEMNRQLIQGIHGDIKAINKTIEK